jgi:Na+-transporting methylmalonyl-CoA/oxaloacetate decarboxylase gamma subunit
VNKHNHTAAEPIAIYVIDGVAAVVERAFPDEGAAESVDAILARLICEDTERENEAT